MSIENMRKFQAHTLMLNEGYDSALDTFPELSDFLIENQNKGYLEMKMILFGRKSPHLIRRIRKIKKIIKNYDNTNSRSCR